MNLLVMDFVERGPYHEDKPGHTQPVSLHVIQNEK